MLSGVAEACDEAGVALVIIPRSRSGAGVVDVVRSAVVDGFVAHCDALDDERRLIVEERRLPIVVLDGRAAADEPSVGIDEEGGDVRRGAPPPRARPPPARRRSPSSPARRRRHTTRGTMRRLAGYRQAVAEAGLDPDVARGRRRQRLRPRRDDRHRPRPARRPRPPDRRAGDERRDGRRRHRRRPRRSACACPRTCRSSGFDDTVTAATSTPPLTTVHQPHAEKGAAAVRMLLADGAGPRRSTFPVELGRRAASTAPPPAVLMQRSSRRRRGPAPARR